MALFWTVRLLVLFSVLTFSTIVLGLSANYISNFSSFTVPGVVSFTIPPWIGLAVASAVLSIIFVMPMVTIDFLRKGAVTSWVVVEVVILSILSVLWLAGAADVTAGYDLSYLTRVGLPNTCHGLDELGTDVEALEISDPVQYGYLSAINFDQLGMMCRSHEAVQAFAFLSWIFPMGYAITLFILAFLAQARGHPAIWTSTVRDTMFYAPETTTKDVAESNVPMTQEKYALGQSVKAQAQGLPPSTMSTLNTEATSQQHAYFVAHASPV
ncbi:hypothetical protein DFH11DRAFT_1601240 [Phellopilus nigrolimitatus]|nr:hypothetical protein DFH11DRAFT_1601240 [Phellopilus nigrolimitatus]